MAYRGDDAGDALEAPTAEGILTATLGANRIDLTVAGHSLHIAERLATLIEHKKQKTERRGSVKIAGNLVVARGFPREDMGIWIERLPEPKRAHPAPDPHPSMQRIFGVTPLSLLHREGLGALSRLDLLAQRLRSAIGEHAGDIRRAVEIGRGLDKVLLADHGDHYVFYARRLFRDRARFAMAVHGDGKIIVPDGKRTREIRITSRFGITVRGDYIRFADRHGTDLAKVSLPWIGPEDRDDIARRIGQFIDRD